MKNAQARTTYLKDYQPSDFLIETTDLSFDLYEDHAKVVSKLLIKRNSLRQESSVDTLVLNGQLMVLEGLLIDGKELSDQDYLLDDET